MEIDETKLKRISIFAGSRDAIRRKVSETVLKRSCFFFDGFAEYARSSKDRRRAIIREINRANVTELGNNRNRWAGKHGAKLTRETIRTPQIKRSQLKDFSFRRMAKLVACFLSCRDQA